MIWGNSTSKAWDWLGMRGRIITIVIAALVIALSWWSLGKPFDLTPVLFTVGLVILLLGVVVIVFVSREPVVIYNSQETELADLKSQLEPGISIVLDKFEPSTGLVGVKIHNAGTHSLERCQVVLLEDVNPRVHGAEKLPAELHWSTNNPDQNGFVEIPRGQTKVLDIAEAKQDFSRGNFTLRRRDNPVKFDPGQYSIKFAISGKSKGTDLPAQIYTARIILDKGLRISIEDIRQYTETNH
jgi:hypothetical protein